jgi:L-ascorbate metabolism protein UlaG (beta-lactamase superfamily)
MALAGKGLTIKGVIVFLLPPGTPKIWRSIMRFLFIASAVVLLGFTLMPTNGSGEEKELSGDRITTDKGSLVIHPVQHGTFLMQWNGKTLYVDPVGDGKTYTTIPRPDLVLVTHSHFDHFDPLTLEALIPTKVRTVIVAPKSVSEKIPEALRGRTTIKVLANGEKTEVEGITITAVPAYNTTPGREKFHPRGRDNGYVLTMGGKKVYIAGDTEDTVEMRALKGIDIAFLPMNMPYTMSVPKAAEAIRQFRPKVVYPYHYRSGDKTKADFEQLRKLVGEDSQVEIRIRNWYPEP